MRRIRALRLLSLVLVPALFAAACSQRDDDDDAGTSGNKDDNGSADSSIDTSNCSSDPSEEISGDTITLVSSYPQSGLTAAFAEIAKGWQSYFEMVNAEGGVKIGDKSYKLAWKDKDDTYDAAKTVANVDELLGTSYDKGLGAFSVVGTSNNLAIRDKLAAACVPNMFAATGSPAWGNPDYPWLIGSTLPPYSLESYVFADLLKKEKPNAKVAMLVQDDDFGAGYEDSFKRAIEGTDIKLTKVERYAPGATSDVSTQVTSLAASGADVFFDGATLLPCPDALTKASQAGWKRDITWVSGTCISKTLMGLAGEAAQGVYSISNIKDPLDPQYNSDEAMSLYKEQVKKYAPDADIENGIVAYGWTQGAVFVKALEEADGANRLAIMEAVRALDLGDDVGLLSKGTGVLTDGEADPYMGERFNLVQYEFQGANAKNHFKVVDAYDYEGKTAELTPEELVNGN